MNGLRRLRALPAGAFNAFARNAGFVVDRYPSRESLAGHLMRLFAIRDVECVLDVGANVGQFGTMLRRAGYAGRIISFEPVPEAFAKLSARTDRDGLWEARRLALGDRPGVSPINVAVSKSVSSFLTPTAEYASGYAGGRIERVENVEVERLDSIFDSLSIDARVFLKVDTQGRDLAVVKGASGCLDPIVAIQIEMSVIPIYDLSENYIAAFTFMHEQGFTPTGVFPVVRDDELRVYEFDGVFTRRLDRPQCPPHSDKPADSPLSEHDAG